VDGVSLPQPLIPHSRCTRSGDPQIQPEVERLYDEVRPAYLYGGIREVPSHQCGLELAVLFSREVVRFGTDFPSWFIRAGYIFLREDTEVAATFKWVPRMAH